MDLSYTPEEEAFRQEVPEFLAKELTDEVAGSMFVNSPARVAFVDGLADEGVRARLDEEHLEEGCARAVTERSVETQHSGQHVLS